MVIPAHKTVTADDIYWKGYEDGNQTRAAEVTALERELAAAREALEAADKKLRNGIENYDGISAFRGDGNYLRSRIIDARALIAVAKGEA